jgi:hypothetical protein
MDSNPLIKVPGCFTGVGAKMSGKGSAIGYVGSVKVTGLHIPNCGDALQLLGQLEGGHHQILSDPRKKRVEMQMQPACGQGAFGFHELVTKRMLAIWVTAHLQ